MEKLKLEDVVKEIAKEALFEALGTARPKYKGLNDKEFALVLGLSEAQYDHLMNKALGRVTSEKLAENMVRHLEQGNSIEVPHGFNIFVHQSEVRRNDNGVPVRKISVRTRKALKDKLNTITTI